MIKILFVCQRQHLSQSDGGVRDERHGAGGGAAGRDLCRVCRDQHRRNRQPGLIRLQRRKLAEHGIGCAGKTARQLRRQDYEIFDLLIGMDSANLRNMCRMCGGDEENKIHAMMDYTDRPGEVADPWYTGNFEDTWRDVNAGCRGLLEQLKREAL